MYSSKWTVHCKVYRALLLGLHWIVKRHSSHQPDTNALQNNTLHCTLLHFTVLHCTALHCAALHYTALNCTGLHCTTLHCTALHCTALHYTRLHWTALHCTALYCTVRFSMVQHYTAQCTMRIPEYLYLLVLFWYNLTLFRSVFFYCFRRSCQIQFLIFSALMGSSAISALQLPWAVSSSASLVVRIVGLSVVRDTNERSDVSDSKWTKNISKCNRIETTLCLLCTIVTHLFSILTSFCASYDTSTKSTKGASKMRRDSINSVINNLRDLLPIPGIAGSDKGRDTT